MRRSNFNVFVLALFFFESLSASCNFNTSSFIEELKSPESITSIDVKIPDSKKWNKNLLKITLDRSSNIDPKFRDRFSSKIKVNYKFGHCEYDGRVRISGDWKDHVEFNEGQFKTSLDIKLFNGNILNSVNFKLLIPTTRNSENEILGALILRDFGFISPETFMVKAKVNDSTSTYLFQENSAKEMLERNLRREGPIFEGNEDLLWSYKDYETMELMDISLSRQINDDWAKKGLTSTLISLNSFIELQKIYLEYTKHELREANNQLDQNFKNYAVILLAMNGSHALYPHNRKYYFNALDQRFEPIYYDGDLRLDLNLSISAIEDEVNLASFLQYYDPDQANTYLQALNKLLNSKIFFNSFNERLVNKRNSKIFFSNSINQMIQNLNTLNAEFKRKESRINNQAFIDLDQSLDNYLNRVRERELENFIVYTSIQQEDNNFYISSSNDIEDKSNSKKINIEELSKIVSDNEFEKKRAELVPRLVNVDRTIFKEINFLEGKIFYSANVKIDIDINNKNLNIVQHNSTDWVLFKDVNLHQWAIKFLGLDPDESTVSLQRFNDLGLTGCLNFYNSIFNETNIKVVNGQCEDSLNIINSRGSIDLIQVNNAFSDGVDIDFSDVQINRLTIMKSDNDCFDVSGGKYLLSEAILFNCGDKGISVGELSELKLKRGEINSANMGISTKDFSTSVLENISIENVEICAEAFQKKQEFGGGNSVISNLINCDGAISFDENSTININPTS